MSNLIIRSIAGIVFSVAVIGSALLGPLTLGLLFFIFTLVGLYELYELQRQQQESAPRWFFGMAVGALIYVLTFLYASGKGEGSLFWILAAVIPVMFCLELIRLDKSTLPNLAITVFGWIYVVLPFSLLNLIAHITGSYDYELPIGFFFILWANDTGAYFTGKFLGRHKLYEKVSPNKTWEGLFGGVALSFLVAWIFSEVFFTHPTTDWLVCAGIVSVFGNLGDLFESHIKRTYNVKDSGNIIPGHGGVLDRFDGLFLALPVLVFYFYILA